MNSKIYNIPFIDVLQGPPSISLKRKTQILEAALKLIIEHGYEGLTFDKIAKQTKLKRTLIHHYFHNKDEIVDLLIIYVRTHYQNYVVTKMKTQVGNLNILQAYIESALTWPLDFKDHIQIWLLFYYWCGIKESSKKTNTNLVQIGHQRICHLIAEGIKSNDFKINHPLESVAKQLQVIITGAVITLSTEDSSAEETKYFLQQSIDQCLSLVGINKTD